MVAVVAPETADAAAGGAAHGGARAALIGEIRQRRPQVVLATSFGGQRVLDELEDDPLPRIC